MAQRGVMRCLLAAVLFGTSTPAAARLAGSMPAFTLAGLLYLGAAIAVVPAVVRRPPARSAVAGDWKPAVIAVLAGGAAGPVLLMAGLARTDAATGSILLNGELVATVVLAALLFREHLGRRVVLATALVTSAGVVLAWTPGAAPDPGALLIIAACFAWGLDNVVTARIEHLRPEHVVALKGVAAGGVNLAIGLATVGLGAATGRDDVLAALAIGAGGYGVSISMWVKGARELGAARGQVLFSTAPFIGALVAWTVFGEAVTTVHIVAGVLAAVGVGLSLRSGHEHVHRHDSQHHDHEHEHDEHHDHAHTRPFEGRHSHPHDHRELVHSHPHVPDLHHRHVHDRLHEHQHEHDHQNEHRHDH